MISRHYISTFILFHSDLWNDYEKGNKEKLINV